MHIEELTKENYDTCKQLNDIRKQKDLQLEKLQNEYDETKAFLEAEIADKNVEIEDLRS